MTRVERDGVARKRSIWKDRRFQIGATIAILAAGVAGGFNVLSSWIGRTPPNSAGQLVIIGSENQGDIVIIDELHGDVQQGADARRVQELEEQLAPRSLSTERRDAMVAALSLGPMGAVDVTIIVGGPEAKSFGEQIIAALREAEWDVSTRRVGLLIPTPYGLRLRVTSADGAPRHAVTLQTALKSAGFDAPGLVDSGAEPGTVRLVVGLKPVPHVGSSP